MPYNPSLHTASNKPYGTRGKPVEARTYFYDDGNSYRYRQYQSIAEVLAYLPTADDRRGSFDIIINTGGTIQSSGYITGGTNAVYWFKDGLADENLVLKVPDVDLTPIYEALTELNESVTNAQATANTANAKADVALEDIERIEEEELPLLQPKIDNSLNTTNKSVVPAINELNGKIVATFTIQLSDLESDAKTYINPSLEDKTFFLFQNGISRFLQSGEFTITPSGGFVLANELSSGDSLMLMGQISGVEGNGLGSKFAIVETYADIITNPLWGGNDEVNFYVTTDNQNMGGKKGAYKYVPTFTPTPAQMAINFND